MNQNKENGPAADLVSMERDRVYSAALETWGAEAQTRMLFEEIAELQDAVCKCARGRDSADHVAEEIADVQIMLGQMAVLFGVQGAVEEYRETKITRLAAHVERARREREAKTPPLPMTLDGAIAHCRAAAEKMKKDDPCSACAAEHEQLAGWLEELRGMKKGGEG